MPQTQDSRAHRADALSSRPTRVRYAVLGLTVAAYMITYMDRQILAVARPIMRDDLGISLAMMGTITFGFRLAYALFQIPGGWLGDRIGPRRALSAVVAWWSVFTGLTAVAWNAISLLWIQVFFGMGEAGAFPIATRSLSRWMRPSERGFAQGITHAGSRFGAALTPPIVIYLVGSYGWRSAFWIFGVLGIAWALAWFGYYRDSPQQHPGVNAAELDLIGGDSNRSSNLSWRALLRHGNLWFLATMYFCYNFNLNVYNDWYPTYLHDSHGLAISQMALYASLPLLAGTIGDIAGGWFSDHLLRRTGNLTFARRSVAIFGFLLSSAATVPAILAHEPKTATAFFCLAFFSLEVTVGVSWAVTLDIGGDSAGSVSAVMNTLGNIGGALSSLVVTRAVGHWGWSAPFLITCVLSVVAALLFLQIDANRRIETDHS